jgi:AcrR family transcriptional regulator
MERDAPFAGVLAVFAYYGFRRASMEDLARAAGISRQTLYNRFKTKDAVLGWAVDGFVREAKARALAALSAKGASPAGCLLDAFTRWTGDHVALLHDAPHGAEILDMGIEWLRRSEADPEAEFEAEVARFLTERGVCRTRKEAADKTFLLLMSAKGLLLKSRTREEFQASMARALRAAI